MKAAIKQLTFVFGLVAILWTAESIAATRLNVYEFKSGTATPAVNLDQAKAANILPAADIIATTSDNKDKKDNDKKDNDKKDNDKKDNDKDKDRNKCRHDRHKCKSPH